MIKNTKKISVESVAFQLEELRTSSVVYLNTETGEFETDYIIDEIYRDSTADYDDAKFQSAEWLPLPNSEDIDEYDIMMSFANSIEKPQIKSDFLYALNGKGAFQRFKERLESFRLGHKWKEFKFKELTKIAKIWCKKHGFECAT